MAIHVNPDPVIDPCWDPVFKSIFTRDSPKSATALRKLLSAILEQPVKSLAVTANEPPVSRIGDRQIRYDIQCVFDTGERANIEMTLHPHAYEPFRLEYYSGRLFTSQEIQGEASYEDLRRTYQISLFASRNLFKDGHFSHRFVYYDPEKACSLGGRTMIVTLELEKLKDVIGKPVVEMAGSERWAVFFKFYREEEKREMIEQIIEADEGIAIAAEVINGFTADEIAFFHEQSKEKYRLDMNSHRREALEQGRAEGLEQGRAEGAAEREELMRRIRELEEQLAGQAQA